MKNSIIFLRDYFLIGITIILLIPSITYAQEIKVINGVKIISNDKPKWDDTSHIQLQFVHKLTAEQKFGNNFSIENPYDITIDKDGKIYILDTEQCSVFIFDSKWEFNSVFGGKGNEKGKFIHPISIEIDNDGRLYISDISNKYITIKIFTSGGIEISSLKLQKPTLGSFILLNSGSIVSRRDIFDHDINIPLVYIFQKDGSYIKGFGEAVDLGNDFANSQENLYRYIKDNNDNIYLIFSYQNRIEKFDENGTLLYKMKRKLNFEFRSGKYEGKKYSRGTLVTRKAGVDSNNRLWLVTDINPKESIFEIFDEEGILLGSLNWIGISRSHDSVGMQIFGNRIFFLDRTNEEIYEYKIIEKE